MVKIERNKIERFREDEMVREDKGLYMENGNEGKGNGDLGIWKEENYKKELVYGRNKKEICEERKRKGDEREKGYI